MHATNNIYLHFKLRLGDILMVMETMCNKIYKCCSQLKYIKELNALFFYENYCTKLTFRYVVTVDYLNRKWNDSEPSQFVHEMLYLCSNSSLPG